jgi:cell wall-associated NlpC family hydrolase
MSGRQLAAAAEQLVGAPFRLHGREPASGLDCVGVLAAALAACGKAARLPNGYALRNRVLPQLGAFVSGSGFAAAAGPIEPGDALLVQAGPGQVHLLVAAGCGGFIHAHAGLRRVVRCHGLPDWPVIAHWRLKLPEIEE